MRESHFKDFFYGFRQLRNAGFVEHRWALYFCALLFTGCATAQKLGRIDCTQLDWFELGRTDGSAGVTNQLRKHGNQCAETLSESLVNQYDHGLEAGLIEYCTSTRGFEAGKANLKNDEICPWPLKEKYLSGFELGQKIYFLHVQNKGLEQKIQNLMAPSNRDRFTESVTSQLSELRDRRSAIMAEINRLENELTTTLL